VLLCAHPQPRFQTIAKAELAMFASERIHAMPRALTIFGMVVAGLIAFVFAFDLALGFPFYKASLMMDICFLICALLLGYLSWATYREQR
jgi:hypothetical protein